LKAGLPTEGNSTDAEACGTLLIIATAPNSLNGERVAGEPAETRWI